MLWRSEKTLLVPISELFEKAIFGDQITLLEWEKSFEK